VTRRGAKARAEAKNRREVEMPSGRGWWRQ
jgi:hypothetical protein